jgi:hypothetical protein
MFAIFMKRLSVQGLANRHARCGGMTVSGLPECIQALARLVKKKAGFFRNPATVAVDLPHFSCLN